MATTDRRERQALLETLRLLESVDVMVAEPVLDRLGGDMYVMPRTASTRGYFRLQVKGRRLGLSVEVPARYVIEGFMLILVVFENGEVQNSYLYFEHDLRSAWSRSRDGSKLVLSVSLTKLADHGDYLATRERLLEARDRVDAHARRWPSHRGDSPISELWEQVGVNLAAMVTNLEIVSDRESVRVMASDLIDAGAFAPAEVEAITELIDARPADGVWETEAEQQHGWKAERVLSILRSRHDDPYEVELRIVARAMDSLRFTTSELGTLRRALSDGLIGEVADCIETIEASLRAAVTAVGEHDWPGVLLQLQQVLDSRERIAQIDETETHDTLAQHVGAAMGVVADALK